MENNESITGRAWFVLSPDRIDDLMKPHPAEKEKTFEVVRRVVIGKMEYENFTTDLNADRQFIEDNAPDCAKGGVWKCLLVQQKGGRDGVLLVPYDERHLEYAAYWPGPGPKG